MNVRSLAVADAYEFTPTQHRDARGVFLEAFASSAFQRAVGHDLNLGQVNTSVSRRDTVRGIHFADVPPGQAKYVTCSYGAVLDVVIDIRVGSPTFGSWDAIRLDDVDRRALYVAEGLGHAFLALSDAATVAYLCSQPYRPGHEHGINPYDPAIGIDWPTENPLLSPKDAEAPTLSEAKAAGLLPSYDECQAHYASMRARAG